MKRNEHFPFSLLGKGKKNPAKSQNVLHSKTLKYGRFQINDIPNWKN